MADTEPKLSRRDFLKLSGLALGGLAFSPQIKRLEIASKEVRLDELGLEDYQEVFREGQKIKNTFGVNPPIFSDVYEILDYAASNNLDHNAEPVQLLRDGWGTHEARMIPDVERHVNDIKIEIDSNQVKDNEADVRNFLLLAAKSYPVHVLALPNKVVIVPGGGLSAGSYIAFTTRLDPEQSAVSFIHEATHELDNHAWKNIKEYVDRKKFANYVATYYGCINDFTQNYLGMTEDQVVEYPIASIYGFDTSNATNFDCSRDFTNQINEWAKKLGINDISVPTNDLNGISSSWTLFLHRVGNKLLQSRNAPLISEETLEEIRQVLTYGFDMPDYNLHFEGLLGAVGHYLVGPVQSRWGGLPSSERQTESNFMIQNDLLLQRVRFNSFSALPYNTTFSQIRESFGLSTDHPVEVEQEKKALVEQEKKALRRLAVIGVCTAVGTNITFNKIAKVATESRQGAKDKKGRLEQFDGGVKESIGKFDLLQLLDDNGQVVENLPDGNKLSLKEVSKDTPFLMHLMEPTFLVFTDINGKDSIIVFSSLGQTRVYDHYDSDLKPKNQIGLLVFGPLFNRDEGGVKVARAVNKNYFIQGNSGITYSNPEGVPWNFKNGSLDLYISKQNFSVKMPWSKDGNVTKVRMGRVTRN